MEFPRLENAKEIAFDTETFDPELLENGPGAWRKKGKLVGFSVATEGFSAYYGIAHLGGGNVEDPENCIKWLKDLLEKPMPKIGANIMYDLEWLYTLGIRPSGLKFDIQTAEALLDETMISYSLENCSQKRLGYGKSEDELMKKAADYLGINLESQSGPKEVKGNMWKLPAGDVAEYGRMDADNTYKIFQVQKPILKEEGLWEPLFITEAKIVDVIFAMREKGIPVDLKKANKVYDNIQKELKDVEQNMAQTVGFVPNIWANDDIKKACDILQVEYPMTEKGNPSFEAKWIEDRPEKFFKLLSRCRKLHRTGNVFIKSKVIDIAHKGRIRPQFWSVKTDSHGLRHGTSSGRFASSNPNIQQVPSRDPEFGPLVKSLFVPEKGCRWLVADWSQQEPRLTVHFGCRIEAPGARTTAKQYIDNPKTDFHQFIASMAEIERKQAKTIFLGTTYGMGKKKLASSLGLTYSEAEILHNKIHPAVPFINELKERTQAVASRRGFIKTLLGRKMRFDLYGPPRWSPGTRPLPLEKAKQEFGQYVQRYFVHKALNRLIQGSAADLMKMAMVRVFEAGYVPHLTLHDELDFSVNSDSEIRHIEELMCENYSLEVPLVVDLEVGPNWGEISDYAGK